MIYLKRMFFKLLGYTPADMEMVQYWKHGQAQEAKLTNEGGETKMYILGEKYPITSFPRGYLLYGRLSKLKHEIKNQIFNETWHELEANTPHAAIMHRIDTVSMPNIEALFKEEDALDVVPPKTMSKSVREFHRAWMKIARNEQTKLWGTIISHILQEDDAYRYRLQWMVYYMGPLLLKFWPVQRFAVGFDWMERGEMVGDMKERVRLVKRGFLALMEDPCRRAFFEAFVREVDWRKIQMGKAEKYHFRAKWFKVDLDKFEY